MNKDIYEIVSFEEIKRQLNPTQDLAFDTETIGLYGKIALAQFYQRQWDKVLVVHNPEPVHLISLLAPLEDVNLVMQNASYDVSTIQTQLNCFWEPKKFSDTLLLARLAFPGLDSYSLDDLLTHIKGDDVYDMYDIDKKAMQKSDWKELTPDKLLYAAIDVYYLLDVYDKVKKVSGDLSYKLDISALKKAWHFQRNGMYLDDTRLIQLKESNEDTIARINLPVNANSWKQVRPYIGENSSDGLALAKYAFFGNEKAAAVKDTRSLLKQNSFIDKYIKTSKDERIFGYFSPSARSGRFTCKEQNLQQIPRALKYGFSAPPGKVLIYSDFAQLELRTIAAITNDAQLCRMFKKFLDAHGEVAVHFFGENYTKDHRQTTKTINFNALYGGGAGMLQGILLMQAGQWLELNTVEGLMRKWKRIFTGIAAWQQRGLRDHRAGRLGSTPFGRQYKGKLMTDQLNIENQGFGADVAKLALHYMYPDIQDSGAQLSNFVHDSYIIEADDDPECYKPLARRVGEAMKDAWSEASGMANVQDIPMPVQVCVGYNWGDIEQGEFICQEEL
jgi:DNA polymerase I-like protein with 3'-5' exonuclease and polymerase domains